MEVDVRVRSLEHAVLVPVRLSDAQHIADSFQGRNVGRLVCRVGNHEHYVYSRFGSKSRYRRRADVFDQQDPVTERGLDPPGLTLEEARPLRIVVDDLDRPGQWRYPPGPDCQDLLLSRG